MLIQQVPEYLGFFGLGEVAAAVQDDLSGVRALFEATD
jgi:shikimate dehydrogenase